MSQFRNKDLNVSQQTLTPGVPNPVTPPTSDASFASITQPSLSKSDATAILPTFTIRQEKDPPPIRRTEMQQLELTHRVSGEDDLSPSTEPVAIISPSRKPKATEYTNNGDLAIMELLICAIMQHIRSYNVIPQLVIVSPKLASKFREDIVNLYGEETFSDTLPFLTHRMTIQRIPIIFYEVPENTALCISGLS